MLKHPAIRSAQVVLSPGSATVEHDANELSTEQIVELIEDAGYDVQLLSSTPIVAPAPVVRVEPQSAGELIATLAISGMTCASCVQTIDGALAAVEGVSSATVDRLAGSAVLHIARKDVADVARHEIEECGFACRIVEVVEAAKSARSVRKVRMRVEGMFCDSCVRRVNAELASHADILTFTPVSMAETTTTLTYTPSPSVNLRLVRTFIRGLGFDLMPAPSDSLEDLAARSQAREKRKLAGLIIMAAVFAVPTFIIAVVGMSLAPMGSAFRSFWAQPVWRNASRGTVSLFALATPVRRRFCRTS